MESPDRRPAEDTEHQDSPEQAPPDPRPAEDDDERADRDADETFPASDPPANY
jgi:hypothetical protein